MARVALTFDDGPSDWTAEMLAVLAEHDVHATFFLIGSSVRGREELVRRLVAEGHEVANHTWSHPSLTSGCSKARIREELVRGGDAIEAAGAPRPRLFRAPHDHIDERVEAVAASLGLVHVPIDVGPPDWHPHWTARLTAAFVAGQVWDGAVIGLHDGIAPGAAGRRATCGPTVEALRILLPVLLGRDLRVVTASEAQAAAVG